MKTRIIVDSTADLTPEVRAQLTVIPLTVRFGEDEYVDGVTIDHQTFYEKLIECETLPSTSQAAPAAFETVFQEVANAGEQAVVITLSSALSGTYQSAMIAAAEYPNQIFVVDSRSVSIGTGILAELALELAEQGLDGAQIAARITQDRERVQLVALLDTLEYLKRGGRISKTAALAGSMLSIKPVVTVRDGQIAVLGKARGSKQGNNLLVTEIGKAGGVDFGKPLLLGYTGISDVLLRKYIEDSKALWASGTDSLRTTAVCSVIGTHAGPGAVAVAFFSALPVHSENQPTKQETL